MTLFHIIWYDILPLFAFMGCGWFLDSRFKIDLPTYSRLNVYVILPCFIFYSLYRAELSPDGLLLIPAAILLMVLLYIVSAIAGPHLTYNRRQVSDFEAVSTFSNFGNIGIAIVMMVYSHMPFLVDGKAVYLKEAMGSMALLMILMNLAVNTFGAAMIRSDKSSLIDILSYLGKMPSLYAALLAVLVRWVGISIEGTFIQSVLGHMDGAFLVLIMVTVGVELHRTHFTKPDTYTIGAAFIKLILSPLLAWAILLFLPGLSLISRQVFFLASAIPSSMSLIIYGAEFKKKSDHLNQAIIFNFFVSIITVTAAIYLMPVLFPM